MRRSVVFSGFVVFGLFGLLGCGGSSSSNGAVDGAQPAGGKTSSSLATGQGGTQSPGTGGSATGKGGATSSSPTGGTGGATGSSASCPTPNPAAATCVSRSADACVPPRCTTCVPSHCGCVTRSGAPGWECTADCRTDLPWCPGEEGDAGRTSYDAGFDRLPDAPAPGPDAILPVDAAASCLGPNPASVACRSSATACVPSSCSCASRSGIASWACTEDCRINLPLCPDAGMVPDAGVVPDTRLASDTDLTKFPCGSNLCGKGEYCCNTNCGQCAPTGSFCTEMFCEPPETWACTSDNDCTVMDDYCGGCNCRALGPKGALGTCTKGLVNCLVAPCSTKSARCEKGQCTLVAK